MSQFLSRECGVVFEPVTIFEINRIKKLLMSPIIFIYQRGDHWGSVYVSTFYHVIKLEIFKGLRRD